jgi:hypothetical protein
MRNGLLTEIRCRAPRFIITVELPTPYCATAINELKLAPRRSAFEMPSGANRLRLEEEISSEH